MKTTFPSTVLELSPEEAIDVYYSLKRQIEHTIATHWVNHPDAFEHHEHRRLHILKGLHRAVGHSEDDVLADLRNQLAIAVKAKAGKSS